MPPTPVRDPRALTWPPALWLALPVLLLYPLAPVDEFIHRGDDAFYYFQLARNHARYGFWSFDGIHPSNGVQALWAWITTALAHLSAWAGVTDPLTLARVFVSANALLTFVAGLGLYRVLASTVSSGTALIAAGAWMLPLGPVWARVWGMENSVYAVGLVAVASTLLAAHREPSDRRAAWLGVALGLTALARFNAGLLVPLACLALLAHTRRWRPALIAGAIASGFVLPYLAWNLISTGHLLPVSGAAKAIYTAQALQEAGATTRFSPATVELLLRSKRSVIWFFATHLASPYWIVGARLGTWHGSPGLLVAPLLIATAGVGLAAGGRAWLGLLRARVRALTPLACLAVYGVLNALVSAVLYPTQLGYAMSRWWFVENELLLVVLAAILLATTLRVVAERVPGLAVPRLAVVAAVVLCVAHGIQTMHYYWDGTKQSDDWNLSWNEFSYDAAQWLAVNVPPGARVGSWNAGVLGYFATQAVVNLDGLINSFEFLPFLRSRTLHDYIVRERIEYLSDMESMVERHALGERLDLEPVYAMYSPLMKQSYRIYRVRGLRPAGDVGH
jgi:hypothetical protein